MEKDGKTWYLCPHHVKEGLFDGLYMSHKPEDHDEWARKKKEKAEKQKRNKSGNSDGDFGCSGGNKKKSKLQFTDEMKQALVSEGNMLEDEATALWNSVMKAQGN